MKSPKIAVLIDQADYSVFSEAARIVRRASRNRKANTEELIEHHFRQRDPVDLAKDYLDAVNDAAARRRVGKRLSVCGEERRITGNAAHGQTRHNVSRSGIRHARGDGAKSINLDRGPRPEDFSRN